MNNNQDSVNKFLKENSSSKFNEKLYKKINDLNSYKNLCEEIIKIYNPKINFPLTKNDLNKIKNYNLNKEFEDVEKEKLKENLNKQFVINDEQRNYIEILKQTLEFLVINLIDLFFELFDVLGIFKLLLC